MFQKTFLIFFGPPGSGKGTQADMLAKKLNLPVVSPGELLRHEEDSNTAIGRKIKPIIDSGKLVPDEIIEKIILKCFKRFDARAGIVFDGYPRKRAQLDFLIKKLEKIAGKPACRQGRQDYVRAILINVSDKEVKRRLGGRRVCDCGAAYHLIYNPPKKSGLCDLCGKKLYIRYDDKPKLIADRLKLYHQKIKPLLDYFEKSDKLIEIDGEQNINQVQNNIIKELAERAMYDNN
ncbi:MAG: nucleoside monophosphate kinase [bacterium]|nr:nucleoside monophosphate kinase [bacterium]